MMRAIWVLLWALAVPVTATAASSDPVRSERATVTLVSDTDAVAPSMPFRLGLRIQMAPGWHSYWRNPGEAGAPTELALTLPEGARAGDIEWPVPMRQQENGLTTYAYTGDLLLPLAITPAPYSPASGDAFAIAAHATWLVCANICVPESGDFRLNLRKGAPAPSAEATLFAAADAAMPAPAPFSAQVSADGTMTLHGAGLSPASAASAWFMPEAEGAIVDSAPQTLHRDGDRLTLSLKPGERFGADAAGLAGVLVLRDESDRQTAYRLIATPGPSFPSMAPPPPAAASASGLPWHLLGLAFLGGLILNLMPCVFPVLAMKALSLMRLPAAARRTVRMEALSYTAGVLLAFVALGAGLILARSAGLAAGWGFQFQSPGFIAVMAWLMFLIGLNLSGVFTVGLGAATGAGQALATRGGHFGSFFTGLLAVVVATPCTAPFMATAIGAALSAAPLVAIAIFAALGLGMASPYLLLAGAPSLARLAPRPGRWMELLKQALAFPMYAATLWLVWVMSQEAGPDGVLAVGLGLLLLGFAAWVLGVGQTMAGRGRRLAVAAALGASVGSLVVFANFSATPVTPSAASTTSGAEPFTAARLAALRESGQPVFVNMTAAWCVTCLVNERIALSTTAVRQAFSDLHVVYLKGDWTRQDPEITAFLHEHGRDGVPLYVYYPPGGRPPIVLSQLLTQAAVLAELQASG